MRLPDHWGGSKVKLLKSLYGLKIAPRYWFNELHKTLTEKLGWTALLTEPGLFYKDVKDSRGVTHRLHLTAYVDDCTVTCSDNKLIMSEFDLFRALFASKIIQPANDPKKPGFEIRDILGATIEYNRDSQILRMHMSKAILKILTKFNHQDCKAVATPCDAKPINEGEVTEQTKTYPLRSLVGSLQHVVQMARPDI